MLTLKVVVLITILAEKKPGKVVVGPVEKTKKGVGSNFSEGVPNS